MPVHPELPMADVLYPSTPQPFALLNRIGNAARQILATNWALTPVGAM